MPLFALIGFGYLAGKLRKIPVEGLAWFNFFILYISLPALFFRLLAGTPVAEFSNSTFVLRASMGTLIIFVLCFAITRIFYRGDTRVATIQGFAGAYGNIGYLGPPLAIAAFGPAAAVPVALIFCVENVLHFTLAPLLMAIGHPAGNGKRQSLFKLVGTILWGIVSHPFIVATILGVSAAWIQFQIPEPVDKVLLMLSSAAAPCALFAMGVTAALRPLKRVPVELFYLVPVKLLVHPVLVYALLRPIDQLSELWLHSAVLLAALPSATNVFVIAAQYGVWEERASSAVVVSTMLSIFTVTGFLYLMQIGIL